MLIVVTLYTLELCEVNPLNSVLLEFWDCNLTYHKPPLLLGIRNICPTKRFVKSRSFEKLMIQHVT